MVIVFGFTLCKDTKISEHSKQMSHYVRHDSVNGKEQGIEKGLATKSPSLFLSTFSLA